MVEGLKERKGEPEPKETTYDVSTRLQNEAVRRRAEGRVIIKGKERGWEQGRQGLLKYLQRQADWDTVGAPGWKIFINHIKQHSGCKAISYFLLGIIGSLAITVGCIREALPSPAPEVVAPGLKVAPKAEWEQKWESTLAEAKKEGIVRVYNLWGAETRSLLSQAFKERYGIEAEFTPFARGADLVARYQAEKRAGLHLADVFGAGPPTLINMMKPEGVLGRIEPLLILPEVIDSKVWSGGSFPYVDKDRMVIAMISSLQRHIAYNTDIMKEGEITAYKDLLKPQYKGKITMGDPSVTGAANSMFGHLAYQLWNLEEASAFMRQLIKQQEAVINRESSLVVEWVARGKYPIGIAGNKEVLLEFINLGAPITVVVQKEGHGLEAGAGGIGVPTISPHPSATAVFVNWLLTKEGQTLFALKGYGQPSLRLDVPTEGIHPLFIPKPGEKLFFSGEDYIMARGNLLEVAKKIMEEASK